MFNIGFYNVLLCIDMLITFLFSDGETGEKLTFNSATNTMGPRKFLHYGTFRKVS